MEPVNKQIKKVVKLHIDSAEYYRTCAHITTEDDLVELFNSLAERREKMSQALVAISPINSEKELWLLRDVFSYLQHAWDHMKVALIINNRQQILKHSFKNEQDMLQDYERMAKGGILSEELRVQHEQMLRDNLQLISDMPIEKFSRQKNLQYDVQKAA